MLKLRYINSVTIIFLLISIADIWAVISQNHLLELYCKPLLMPALALVYLRMVKKRNFWFLSALFFAFLGDVLLLFQKEFFVFGLTMFLFVHLIYLKINLPLPRKIKSTQAIKTTVPFLLLFSLLLFLIKDNLGGLFVPVIIYGITISAFGSVVLLRYTDKKSMENGYLLSGALFFIASDTGIALYNFYDPNPIFSIAVVLFYILAQYLICKAIILRAKTPL